MMRSCIKTTSTLVDTGDSSASMRYPSSSGGPKAASHVTVAAVTDWRELLPPAIFMIFSQSS